MGRRKRKTYKCKTRRKTYKRKTRRKTYKRKTRRKTKTRKKYKGGRKFFKYEKKIKLNLDKYDVPTPKAGEIRERQHKVSLQTPWIVWIGILCSTIASLSLSLGAGSLVAIIGFVVNKLIQYMKKPKMDLLVSMELENKILDIINSKNQTVKVTNMEGLKTFLIQKGYTLDDIKNTTEYLASKAVAGANAVAVAKPVAGANAVAVAKPVAGANAVAVAYPVAGAKEQIKVLVLFDLDETLLCKGNWNEDISTDPNKVLLLKSYGKGGDLGYWRHIYTTQSILKLLQDLTDNKRVIWTIISKGTNFELFEILCNKSDPTINVSIIKGHKLFGNVDDEGNKWRSDLYDLRDYNMKEENPLKEIKIQEEGGAIRSGTGKRKAAEKIVRQLQIKSVNIEKVLFFDDDRENCYVMGGVVETTELNPYLLKIPGPDKIGESPPVPIKSYIMPYDSNKTIMTDEIIQQCREEIS